MTSLPLNQTVVGDCREIMRTWPDESVNMCVTSPPYWGLRDYGIEGQLGLEKTPEEYVAKMVEVFREVRRVLRKDGTCWINLGDSYASGKGTCYNPGGNTSSFNVHLKANNVQPLDRGNKSTLAAVGLKPKDLVGIPWRVAFALQADGWWLRSEIIWHKPNPMPESVTDRPTKAHEQIFLLSKSAKYYYDNEAVKEPWESGRDDMRKHGVRTGEAYIQQDPVMNNSDRGERKAERNQHDYQGGRNKRSVWTVSTAPFSEAHFATFPPKLIEPCILAGCPKEVCVKCGKPRERIVEKNLIPTKKATKTFVVDKRDYEADANDQGSNRQKDGHKPGWINDSKTIGWTDCACGQGWRPGIVLDPFMGSGTTAAVAYAHGRNYVGCEINRKYAAMCRAKRLKSQHPLFEGQ